MAQRKAVLAVWNKAGRGKTETLKTVVEIIKKTFPNFIQLFPSSDGPLPSGDIVWVCKIEDLIIGVDSKGDPCTGLKERLIELLKKWNVDVIFCATRTSGETVAAVEHLVEVEGFEPVWTSTYQVDGRGAQKEANAVKARHIVDLMKQLGYLP
ncbi:hypothetical protein [Luteolibacter soli]|uniref:CobQ/CobB/MinD/ParA nucleotide binding domain-containing protein n=1 Tax=Luteolibacter soli TaxID=3135280 RepID=A0ABU9AWH0_9BACT